MDVDDVDRHQGDNNGVERLWSSDDPGVDVDEQDEDQVSDSEASDRDNDGEENDEEDDGDESDTEHLGFSGF
jgi:hypothetical protein